MDTEKQFGERLSQIERLLVEVVAILSGSERSGVPQGCPPSAGVAADTPNNEADSSPRSADKSGSTANAVPEKVAKAMWEAGRQLLISEEPGWDELPQEMKNIWKTIAGVGIAVFCDISKEPPPLASATASERLTPNDQALRRAERKQ